MIRLSGKKLKLKDISLADQETMGLRWAWKAGASATYIKDYGHDFYYDKEKTCSLVAVHHISEEVGRELWIFDMFLEGGCIWNS